MGDHSLKFSEKHREKIRQITQESIQSALFPTKLMPLSEDHQSNDEPETLLVSILGFQGEKMNGSVILGCDEDFLRWSCPGGKSKDPPSEALIHDWIGELTNLIMGRLKNKLYSYGIGLTLNPPSISEATNSIFETYSSRMPSEILWYTTDKGDRICFLIACDIDTSVDFQPVVAQKENLEPGSGIVSLRRYDLEEGTGEQKDQILNPTMPSIKSDRDHDELQDFDVPVDYDFEDEHLCPIGHVGTTEDVAALDRTLSEENRGSSDTLLPHDSYDAHSISVKNLPPVKKKTSTPRTKAHIARDDEDMSATAQSNRSWELATRENNNAAQATALRDYKQQPLSSFNLTSTGMVEVRFDPGLEFRLDPELLYKTGFKNFKMQGIEVSISQGPASYVLQIAGIEILVARKVA